MKNINDLAADICDKYRLSHRESLELIKLIQNSFYHFLKTRLEPMANSFAEGYGGKNQEAVNLGYSLFTSGFQTAMLQMLNGQIPSLSNQLEIAQQEVKDHAINKKFTEELLDETRKKLFGAQLEIDKRGTEIAFLKAAINDIVEAWAAGNYIINTGRKIKEAAALLNSEPKPEVSDTTKSQ